MSARALPSTTTALLARLRSDLEAAEYRVDVLEELLGLEALSSVPVLRATLDLRAQERSRSAGGTASDYAGPDLAGPGAATFDFAGAGAAGLGAAASGVAASVSAVSPDFAPPRDSTASVDAAHPATSGDALRGPSPAEAIARFFIAALPLTPHELERAFPNLGYAGLVELGLVRQLDQESNELDQESASRPSCMATFDLRPYSFSESEESSVNLWVLSDLGVEQTEGVLPPDYVLGIGQASLTLAQLVPRHRVHTALDLGVGCGIQTFHLLRHAQHVVATDISSRALTITEFNLMLNAPELELDVQDLAARVQLREGSLLEPVQGEHFDLIVSNPPFVITPREPSPAQTSPAHASGQLGEPRHAPAHLRQEPPSQESPGQESPESADLRFTYRDGGLEGDAIVASLVRELPEHLSPQGTAHLLGNWEYHSTHQEPLTHPRQWVENLGAQIDAWFIQRDEASPLEYARTWLRDAGEERDAALFERRLIQYLLDFRHRHVERVGFGYIWLRRRASALASPEAPLRRFEVLEHSLQEPLAPWQHAAVVRWDALMDMDDAAFLQARLRVGADVSEERHAHPGAEHPAVILLRQGSGFRRTTLMDTQTAGFVSACDGTLAVGALANVLQELLQPQDPEFTPKLLHDVRALVLAGFLELA